MRGYPLNIWPYMVQYLHFRILEVPLSYIDFIITHVNSDMFSSWAGHGDSTGGGRGSTLIIYTGNLFFPSHKVSGLFLSGLLVTNNWLEYYSTYKILPRYHISPTNHGPPMRNPIDIKSSVLTAGHMPQ